LDPKPTLIPVPTRQRLAVKERDKVGCRQGAGQERRSKQANSGEPNHFVPFANKAVVCIALAISYTTR
jgi:hypothetical protein